MIDPRRLQVLRILAMQGTVSATAAAMHLSPSAVSQQIRQLARELDMELLAHQGRGVRLTSTAESLIDYADRVAAEWERTAAELQQCNDGVRGVLKICGFATSIPSLLIPAVSRLRIDYPNIGVELAEAGIVTCLDQLLTYQSDIAIIPGTGAPSLGDKRFELHPLLEEPQDLVVPIGHSLITNPSPLEAAALERWIAPHIDQRQLIIAACAAVGFTPEFRHQADDWNAVLALVEQGYGLCLLPRLATIHGRGLVRLPLREFCPTRSVLACIRRGSAHQPAIARALDALKAVSSLKLVIP